MAAMIYTIGLTGGIGSGKSTVARLFAARGVPIIDADAVAHELTLPDTPATREIAEKLGSDLLQSDGSLDRAKLRGRAFADPVVRDKLESVLHPLIRAEMLRQRDVATGEYCVLVVPLLVEKGWGALVDRALVVDCSEETQVARCIARDGRAGGEIRAVMAAQVSRAERLAAADDVIVNEDGPEALEAAVDALDRQYRAFSRATGLSRGEYGE